MPKKVQITVTLEKDYVDYITNLADAMYEGNKSMAFRKIIGEHSRDHRI